jgi:hypothetical protein
VQTGSIEHLNDFVSVPGIWRDVSVDLKIVNSLNRPAISNPAFRELKARGGKPQSVSADIIFRTQFQFDENQPELVISVLLDPESIAYAIILEVSPSQRPVADLFDDLAETCNASPFKPPSAQLTAVAHGLLTLLRKFHQGGMAFGADLRRFCLLADFRTGQGKTIAAHLLDESENPVAVLLGDANHVQEDSFNYDTEYSRPAQGIDGPLSKRPRVQT